ncbi:MAG: endopeptidase La [Bacteroidota bacterium]
MFEDIFELHGFDEEAEFLPLVSLEGETEKQDDEKYPDILPVLALKNTVLFPGIVIPITVGRERSIKAINKAYSENKIIAVISQREDDVEDPSFEDLYDIGTIARIVKILRMPDGTITAILQGRKRGRLVEMLSDVPYMQAVIEPLSYIMPSNSLEFEAMISSILDMAKQIIELSPNIPSEAIMMLRNINSHGFLLNFIASNLGNKVTEKQQILEIHDLNAKAIFILEKMENELRLLELKDQIETRVRGDIEKQQRDYYLNQQLKTIQDELGQNPQEGEVSELLQRAKKKKWNEEVQKAFDREIAKIRRLNPQSPEYSVQLTYVELMLDLPWNEYTKDNFDLKRVQKVLDKDHFGLEKVKERILEHLAVLKLKGDMKAPILCLVGPPGVGKTSLGKSIARALKRKFVRMSLGGLHDESEIRGHRKTYIGAMPGRILQSLKKSKASNPVFILDEIDKVGKDFRGDPSSALLEVLDPEQNSTFHDNYLDIEYDLSKVFFIATANSLSTIQPALLDRMEIIQISGYSTEEKVEIAKKHLIPKQREEHGLKAAHIRLSNKTLTHIIENYTRESGVRSLNRQIASVMRRVAKNVAMEDQYNISMNPADIGEILGPNAYSRDRYQKSKTPGVAVGLAWTQVGGDILFIEASLNQGNGKLTLTGNLGDVMKESATTALSYIKAHAAALDITQDKLKNQDIHIHVPEGAIPKDGPSAGITMLTALTSAFAKKPVRAHLAMTGEITLRGKVLPVGGIKEKVLAAKRAGLKDIVLCKENEKHIKEINSTYIKDIKFHYVDRMQEVLDIALG